MRRPGVTHVLTMAWLTVLGATLPGQWIIPGSLKPPSQTCALPAEGPPHPSHLNTQAALPEAYAGKERRCHGPHRRAAGGFRRSRPRRWPGCPWLRAGRRCPAHHPPPDRQRAPPHTHTQGLVVCCVPGGAYPSPKRLGVTPASVLCMSWCAEFAFRVAQRPIHSECSVCGMEPEEAGCYRGEEGDGVVRRSGAGDSCHDLAHRPIHFLNSVACAVHTPDQLCRLQLLGAVLHPNAQQLGHRREPMEGG